LSENFSAETELRKIDTWSPFFGNEQPTIMEQVQLLPDLLLPDLPQNDLGPILLIIFWS
jgi:hypothetical protein